MGSKDISRAMRVGTDLVSGIMVGTLLGRLSDDYAGTHPWGLVIFIIFGTLAGCLNVYRLVCKKEPMGD
ncbi:MAG: AtpZ/AtpI family protein [Alphaproteobacteria bacterium]|nr:AtpZ/AtpI family protein [Alphaproteobacteria bacterium]